MTTSWLINLALLGLSYAAVIAWHYATELVINLTASSKSTSTLKPILLQQK